MHASTVPSARQLRLLGLLLLAIAAAVVLSVALGVFDPRPQGELADTIWPGRLAVGPGETVLEPIALEPTADAAYTLRLTAAHAGGEVDSGYGLALGDDERTLVVAVSPVGYLSIWEQDAQGNTRVDILPWQPWPHVHGDRAANEIWIDVEPSGELAALTVRLNRELLWQGMRPAPGPRAGLWAGSFGGAAEFDFQRLERFVAAPTAGVSP